MRAQDAAVRRARGDVVAFSDANSTWEPDALARLVEPFADPESGTSAARCASPATDGSQEGAYWRYEMRCASSSRASLT